MGAAQKIAKSETWASIILKVSQMTAWADKIENCCFVRSEAMKIVLCFLSFQGIGPFYLGYFT